MCATSPLLIHRLTSLGKGSGASSAQELPLSASPRPPSSFPSNFWRSPPGSVNTSTSRIARSYMYSQVLDEDMARHYRQHFGWQVVALQP